MNRACMQEAAACFEAAGVWDAQAKVFVGRPDWQAVANLLRTKLVSVYIRLFARVCVREREREARSCAHEESIQQTACVDVS